MNATCRIVLRAPNAVFLTESAAGLTEGAGLLDRLTEAESQAMQAEASPVSLPIGAQVFAQGDPHEGIWLIRDGIIRTYYVAPSGRELTLALWTRGHFVGGPEVFGGGTHVWSAVAVEVSELLFLPGEAIRRIVENSPRFAACIIDGLVAKAKCYSAFAQMLGTRPAAARLAQLLLLAAQGQGRKDAGPLLIEHRPTHEDLARAVGATRQWVTAMLERFEKGGIIRAVGRRLAIERPDLLREVAES